MIFISSSSVPHSGGLCKRKEKKKKKGEISGEKTYTKFNIYSECKSRVFNYILIAGITCWLERRTRDRKVASSNPSRSGGRIFFSRVNFVCYLLFGVGSTPVLPQWHVKDPSPSAQNAGGRLHLNMHTPLTQQSRSGLTMPLSSLSVGTYLETSSQGTRQETLGHSRLGSMSHCGQILA